MLIFDHTERTGQHTVIVDDVTGHSTGIPLSDEVKQRLTAAQLPLQTPARGDNAKPGTNVANVVQQAWLTDVVTKALLPMFKERGKPFVIVFWSRDPDATQHGQGDSPLRLVPGINGPTSLAAIRNADDCLARLLTALKEQGLDGTTDIVLTSDHGFSTISKESATSWAATQSYKDVPAGLLPPGFVAIDLAHALGLKLYEANGTEAAPGTHPSHALIGDDPKKPVGRRRRQWRLRPDLSADRRQGNWPPRSSALLSRAGLYERHFRRRCAGQDRRAPCRCRRSR